MSSNDARAKVLEAIRSRTGKSRLVKVAVPEWGVDVYVKRLDLKEKFAFERRMAGMGELSKDDPEEQAHWRAGVCIETALDAEGKPIFSVEDEPLLVGELSNPVERVVRAALHINTVPQEALEDLGKESVMTRNGASPSASSAISEE